MYATAAANESRLKEFLKSSYSSAAEERCASSAPTSWMTRSHGLGMQTPIWRCSRSRAAALRTVRASTDAASYRRTSNIPIARSQGTPSTSTPPRLAQGRMSARASA